MYVAKDRWMISRDQLQEWYDNLNKEFCVKDDGIYTVKAQIQDIFKQMKDEPVQPKTELSFHDIQVGKEYVFNGRGRKDFLRGKRCQIVKKNRTKVVAKLLEDTTNWPKGTDVTTPPSCLEEV